MAEINKTVETRPAIGHRRDGAGALAEQGKRLHANILVNIPGVLTAAVGR